VHATRHTDQCIAAVMDHVVDGPPATLVQSESFPHLARTTVMARLEPGQRLRLVKFVAHSWSGSRSSAALRDQADSALGQAAKSGWDGLLADQRAYLDDFWDRTDVQLDGDVHRVPRAMTGREAVERGARPGQRLASSVATPDAMWIRPASRRVFAAPLIPVIGACE